MKKVLLIGKLTEVLSSINENLSEKYNVQLSSMQLDNIMGMVKIAKPDLIVICMIGTDRVDNSIFEWMNRYFEDIPVIIISSKEVWDSISILFRGSKYTSVLTPINKDMLIMTCDDVMAKMAKTISVLKKDADKKQKVLVIDDSPIVLRSIKGLLEDKYDVIIATNGEMGIQKTIDQKPDIVLLDYEMPGMNGSSTFEMILQIDDIKDIPVVFLTSVSDAKRVKEVLEKHPAGYILKPPDKDVLIELIEGVLNQ